MMRRVIELQLVLTSSYRTTPSLADRGLDHHEMPVPRGALVFSAGPDGNHVDISRGDGTYVSGGVQGLSPGYGDGHDIQILPTPNLGSWTLYGWVYPPW